MDVLKKPQDEKRPVKKGKERAEMAEGGVVAKSYDGEKETNFEWGGHLQQGVR